ncbi:TPA: hypothetical protein HNC36_28180 [Escherichia coli]|nr:hypothetical protein [Escherichia coli]
MYIYFFPVDFSERDSFIKSECGYQKNKGKDYLVINRWDCQTLSFCQSSDRLYIIAHGNTSVIGDGIRRTEKLTPEDLAKVLYGLGLPKYFEDVRLFSCYSGVSNKFASYAQRLKEALKERGYCNIMVTGYLGMVDCGRDFRLLKDGSAFYTKRSKGIFPENNLIQSAMCLSMDDVLKYRASDFKIIF